jgi:putative ubiquitin-RnfH superfamily antitoxin RatB of RatAB toxin-antitoxin module
MSDPDALSVEVVYARPERQSVVRVPLADGMTALDAVRASGLLEANPGLGEGGLEIGIYGRVVGHGQALRAGDRVEIYRQLKVDPREARRRRVAATRGTG